METKGMGSTAAETKRNSQQPPCPGRTATMKTRRATTPAARFISHGFSHPRLLPWLCAGIRTTGFGGLNRPRVKSLLPLVPKHKTQVLA